MSKKQSLLQFNAQYVRFKGFICSISAYSSTTSHRPDVQLQNFAERLIALCFMTVDWTPNVWVHSYKQDCLILVPSIPIKRCSKVILFLLNHDTYALFPRPPRRKIQKSLSVRRGDTIVIHSWHPRVHHPSLMASNMKRGTITNAPIAEKYLIDLVVSRWIYITCGYLSNRLTP